MLSELGLFLLHLLVAGDHKVLELDHVRGALVPVGGDFAGLKR